MMATPPSILKVKPTTTNTTTIAEEEEGGGGMDEHPRPEGEEEQPAVPRKIRCVQTDGSLVTLVLQPSSSCLHCYQPEGQAAQLTKIALKLLVCSRYYNQSEDLGVELNEDRLSSVVSECLPLQVCCGG